MQLKEKINNDKNDKNDKNESIEYHKIYSKYANNRFKLEGLGTLFYEYYDKYFSK